MLYACMLITISCINYILMLNEGMKNADNQERRNKTLHND